MKQTHAANCKLESNPQNSFIYHALEPSCFCKDSPNITSFFHLSSPVFLFPETITHTAAKISSKQWSIAAVPHKNAEWQAKYDCSVAANGMWEKMVLVMSFIFIVSSAGDDHCIPGPSFMDSGYEQMCKNIPKCVEFINLHLHLGMCVNISTALTMFLHWICW